MQIVRGRYWASHLDDTLVQLLQPRSSMQLVRVVAEFLTGDSSVQLGQRAHVLLSRDPMRRLVETRSTGTGTVLGGGPATTDGEVPPHHCCRAGEYGIVIVVVLWVPPSPNTPSSCAEASTHHGLHNGWRDGRVKCVGMCVGGRTAQLWVRKEHHTERRREGGWRTQRGR